MKWKTKVLLLALVTIGSSMFAYGQSCPVDSTYLIVRIEPNDRRTPFEFEGSYIFRSLAGKSSFRNRPGTAPFELRVAGGAGFVMLRGRSGDGKLLFKYRTT